jgi:serine acetyltransferase
MSPTPKAAVIGAKTRVLGGITVGDSPLIGHAMDAAS